VQLIQQHLELFLKHLEDYIGGLQSKKPDELYKPEKYILSLGGKRVRPILALMACDLFDKPASMALNSALCVELFHNFSLIHDDILDNAPIRRGKPTVHEKWNTNIAILSGDVMLVKAFEILQSYPAEQFKSLSTLFSKTAIEVCEGQQMDMNFETQKNISTDDYVQMITYKTAVLLGCSLQMGAINAGAAQEDQNHIYAFGKHLGIAFQLLDDVLDAFADDQSKFGKQIGGDILANKKTFLLLKATELANKDDHEKLKSLLKQQLHPEQKIKDVIELYVKLGVKDLALQEADAHTKIALEHLFKINASTEKKNQLQLFAIHLLNRTV
jgi:geranylgeranyl diphosphate synthase, type II